MEIKILGPGCAKCNKTMDIVKTTIAETGTDVNIEKVTDMMKIASYKVFSTPAVVVDGKVKCSGKIPKKKEILSWLGQ